MLDEKAVLAALGKVMESDLGRDVVALQMVKDLQVRDSKVSFTLESKSPRFPGDQAIEAACRKAVASLPEVEEVEIRGTFEVTSAPRRDNRELIPEVKNSIAVASGKGGVGKSTVAINLAVTLARMGARVGLLDADIYGPSIPMMAGISGVQSFESEGGKIAPVRACGIKVMSMGFILQEDQPVIWRGPMVHQALRQFLGDVHWGELDYLVLDLPPGTGDIQLTLVQSIPLTGSVITCTPQDVALLDAKKGLRMFQQVNTQILGIVENMSWYECPHCGQRTDLFSHGGAKAAAAALQVPFLGAIPIDVEVRVSSDSGKPYMAGEHDDTPVGKAYLEVARNLTLQIKVQNHRSSQSKVSISIKR
ncbi:MAG: Mrp/NBP35 family ATP-binding protein [Planctomycetes bacterium]|nr:Mrp/NBP35 family ATP-binding protein [Planctomycetota bacterium]